MIIPEKTKQQLLKWLIGQRKEVKKLRKKMAGSQFCTPSSGQPNGISIAGVHDIAKLMGKLEAYDELILLIEGGGEPK